LAVTDEVVRGHLSGCEPGWEHGSKYGDQYDSKYGGEYGEYGLKNSGREFVMGVYPMLLDETCWFLAADFDKVNWREDVAAFLETCRRVELPAVVERSRSGNGGHVWLFFEQAVPAVLARKLGAHLLTETMERRPDVGLDSYDRFFPNQDTLPRGGFGNLIALPLQKGPREQGNSVFLDVAADFAPHSDQWAFLASIEKITRARAEEVVRAAEGKGRVVGVRLSLPEDDEDEGTPWASPPSRRHAEPPIVGPLPENLELVLGDQIYIAKDDLSAPLRNRLTRLAAFQNPEFYKAQAMRLPTYDKPRVIACAEDFPKHIGLPRGCLDDVRELLDGLRIQHFLRDERCQGQPLDVTFHGELRPEQQPVAEAMLAHDTGVLSATTAFGKTVLAAWLIAQRRVNTLVLVHRRQLLEQWAERLATFLGLPTTATGRIGGGRKKSTGLLDVAVIQSLVRKGVVDDRVGDYGQLIVDECHHLSAQSFEQVARRAKAKFVIGLSATVARKDGHHPIIFMQCGPVRHRVDAKTQALARPFTHSVFVRPTEFFPRTEAASDVRVQFQDLYGDLIADDVRNGMICQDVVQAVREGRSPVVLTERTDHLERLAERLSPDVQHVVVLRGGMGRKQLRATADRLVSIPADEPRVLLATGRYIGEGFDDARLDTLFLTLPISWRGTVAQYAGRLHRLHDRKREVRIYDYADLNVPMLSRMFDRRCRGYEAIGYSIHLPASAVPGWPADVPLPVDPQRKQDYAASVRRLIRDGVDSPLANLFVHAASRDAGILPACSEGVPPSADLAADLPSPSDRPHRTHNAGETPAPREAPRLADELTRARSATEAFLYRRLATLPQTAGLFRLNAELPIAFDGWSKMEVDLLCPTARLAIELDGDQHLNDPEAYRRDRRKDALLQENNYFVLRFLAQDIAKNLDTVLDTILRTLVNRRQGAR